LLTLGFHVGSLLTLIQLFGFYAVQMQEALPVFQWYMLPQPSGLTLKVEAGCTSKTWATLQNPQCKNPTAELTSMDNSVKYPSF
jgi:hypothetical protein